MKRYHIIDQKNPREIVLLQSYPCHWGRCSFCDYIEDNNTDKEEMLAVNSQTLSQVTGCFGQLEIINSASVFELPIESLLEIRSIAEETQLHSLYFEVHYSYRHKLDEIRSFFPNQRIYFKCGIETFDDHFRNKVLLKGVHLSDETEPAQFFHSICLLIGIQGQSKSMIRRDIAIAKRHYPHVCINLFEQNHSACRRDPELIAWFRKEFSSLEQDMQFDILWNNTDYGVGADDEQE